MLNSDRRCPVCEKPLAEHSYEDHKACNQKVMAQVQQSRDCSESSADAGRLCPWIVPCA